MTVILISIAMVVASWFLVGKYLKWRNQGRDLGWINMPVDDYTVHTVPQMDLMLHLTENCPCNPRTEPVQHEDGGIGWLIIHNAKDGRK